VFTETEVDEEEESEGGERGYGRKMI